MPVDSVCFEKGKIMKIIHVCLAVQYVEGFGYQENTLTQLHAEMGHEVTILTTDRIFNSKYEQIKREKTEYVNDFGVHVKVLPRSRRYGYYSRFRDFDNVYASLEAEKPDIIFVHGGQTVALKDIIKYCKRHHDVKLYIDQHGDYYNMHVNSWKERLVHHHIYGHWMRKAVPYVRKYWGVTPWRCQYLREVYKIPEDKIGLLVMGGDDRYIHFEQMPQLKIDIRKRLSLDTDDFVLITGGKIDAAKNIHLLMESVISLGREDVKLIVFGQPTDEMAPTIEKLSGDRRIRNIGWLDSTKVYDYFLSSDLAVFPGTHSVLWEQACACGIPGVFKRWDGMQHVDLGGNALFLDRCDKDELMGCIESIFLDREKYQRMRETAGEKCVKEFSYKRIARRAIGLPEE